MGKGPLSLEVCLDLKIKLDRLHHVQEQCQDGLSMLSEGGLGTRDYIEVVERQVRAQRAWEECVRKHFDGLHPRDPPGSGVSRSENGSSFSPRLRPLRPNLRILFSEHGRAAHVPNSSGSSDPDDFRPYFRIR